MDTTLQEALKQYLKDKSIKQVDIALGIKMTPAKLSEILNCKRKMEAGIFFEICDFIGVDPHLFRTASNHAKTNDRIA